MKSLILALGMASLVGCSTLKPVGPFAKETPLVQQGRPLANAPANAAPAPALRPTPPTMLIEADDVTADSPEEAADRLTRELGIDSKTTVNAPVTAEVSRIKGRK